MTTIPAAATMRGEGRRVVKEAESGAAARGWQPVAGERDQARGLLAGLAAAQPATTMDARVNRLREAVVNCAEIGAAAHTRLGQLVGAFVVILAPIMLWHADGPASHSPDTSEIDDAEAAVQELRTLLATVYHL
ncbi:hypothetical protein [Streptomyces sp. cmx-4-9]|uniref:hypothetical protein n=1 Tax=Streptomyces sp. cmx-4-9 TaxID=2790941 RepID=UPI00397F1FAF